MNKEQIIADMAEAMEHIIGYKFERIGLCAEAAYNASPLAHVGELVEALEESDSLSEYLLRCYKNLKDSLSRDYGCGFTNPVDENEIEKTFSKVEQALSRFESVPAPVSVEGWQSMDSAPKRGKVLAKTLGNNVWVVNLNKNKNGYPHQCSCENNSCTDSHLLGWMPLPQTEGNKS